MSQSLSSFTYSTLLKGGILSDYLTRKVGTILMSTIDIDVLVTR